MERKEKRYINPMIIDQGYYYFPTNANSTLLV